MAHTTGPWYWEKRSGGRIRLFTPKNGSCTVMDFTRLGMQAAQPRFSNRGDTPLGGVMIAGCELDLDKHPDARLIAAAPDLLAACEAALDWINRFGEHAPIVFGGEDILAGQLQAAIQKATVAK